MLFVFGYRSKMIRTKKVSQLIHNSENHQNVQSCTVAVHFQKIVDLVSRFVIVHSRTTAKYILQRLVLWFVHGEYFRQLRLTGLVAGIALQLHDK